MNQNFFLVNVKPGDLNLFVISVSIKKNNLRKIAIVTNKIIIYTVKTGALLFGYMF